MLPLHQSMVSVCAGHTLPADSMHSRFLALCVAGTLIAACGGETATEPGSTASGPTQIRVILTTAGIDLPVKDYSISVDGASRSQVAANATATIPINAGSHVVVLSSLPSNCTAVSTSQSVSVATGQSRDVPFSVTCRIRQVAFTSNRSGSGYQIYVMNRDGTDIRQLTTGANDFAGSWSPDGSSVLFSGDDAAGHRQVFAV